MNKTGLLIFVTHFLLFLSVTAQGQQKQLIYEDKAYEPGIRTIQLLPEQDGVSSRIAPAVKNIGDNGKLILEFDDLREDADYYFVRFVHCNADWTPSDLRPGMYVQGYNEFEIEDFEFSSGSKINYVHYRFTLPQFKKTGNYLAVVYRDRNKEDIILSKRFRLFTNTALIEARILRSSTIERRLTHQRVEATVNYGTVRSNDPRRDIKLVVRQNQRPDTERLLPATFLNEAQKELRYQNLNEANDFYGGNEFRFFDLSTVNAEGRNVNDVIFENNQPVARLMTDETRREGYFQTLDLNGQFYIRDLEGGNAFITSEYVQTHFSLEIPESRTAVYLIGAFNGWQKNEASRMSYDKQAGVYRHELLMKQGWYDYMYWSDDPLNEQEFERSFFETENLYEIFVYYRAIGSRGDELIGYLPINYNNRR